MKQCISAQFRHVWKLLKNRIRFFNSLLVEKRGYTVKETLLIWKNILTKPSTGYQEIKPTTNLLRPLLLLLLIALISGLLMIPVVKGTPYWEAYSRATLDAMDRLGQLAAPGARAAQVQAMGDPVMRNINALTAVIVPPLNLLFTLVVGTLLLWLTGFIVRNRIPFGVMLRLFAFTWLVPILAGLIQVVLVLIADHQALFGKANTFLDLSLTQMTPFSLAILFPPGSVGLLVILAVDFLTNIFHIIFYVMLFMGIRALGPDKRPWKAGVAAGVLLVFHFSFVVGRMVLLSL